MPSGQQPLWGWMSSGLCPQGSAAPRATSQATCTILPTAQSRALGSVPATLTSSAGGAIWVGCVRDVCANHTRRHTHTACQRGGSLGPSHPPSEPSSPSPPLQLHPGQQHQPPEQVTCPPRHHWVFSGPGCDPQPEGRGYLPGCENPRRRHRGTCWGVGEGCHLPSRVRATPSLLPRGPLPPL